MTSRILSMLATLALLCSGLAHSQIPRTINYQGYLTSPNGAALNVSVPMAFKMYGVATGGAALHTETQTVAVSNGIFNVVLGTGAALTLPFDTPYYLGVTVGTDAELAPRQALSASPYAIRAASAEALAASAIVPGSQIADASVSAAKLASNGCTGGQVLQFNGSAWVCASPAGSSGGTITGITAGTGLTGGTITTSGTLAADTTVLQRRVAATCAVGSSIRAIAGDGTVTCQTDAIGAGTVTNITAGTGLLGGSITSNGTIAVDTSFLQRRVAATCAAGSSIQAIAADGTVTCQIDAIGSATVTSIATGAGLTGGPITSSGTVNLASTQLLPTLACAADQTVKWNGSSWACATVAAPAAYVAAPQDTVVTAIDNTGLVGAYSSISVAPDGLPVISYYDVTNGDLKVAKCGNPACTSGNTVTAVDTTGNVGQFTSITIGADGLPIISYYDATNGNLKVAKCGNAACTVGNALTAVDTVGNVGQYTSIAIGADGLPIIAYNDATNADLKVAKCGNADCSAGNTLNAVDTGTSVLSTSIAVALDGLPVISYIASAGGVWVVLKCGDAACSPALLAPRNIFTTVGANSSIAMAIGSDGLPAISFYVQASGDLVLAHCVRQNCFDTFSTVTTKNAVDTVGDVGAFTSLAIGADGMPVMSYIDITNGVLKVAKCDNVDCSGTPWLRVIGSAGGFSSGQATSIAIGVDGTPVISFQDRTSGAVGALKVAKCSNASCAPFFRRR
jgi:hypothetical protein